ncbi:MAG: FtsX-like permease family protein [Actinomycetaceae bacterium]|jgi:cell division transport system permease protein|nr:FtsX-like permease family protein [Actinomycetaceae bacterium]
MRFRFVISRTFKGLFSNSAMALSVALVTFVSLLFVGAAVLLQTQIGSMKDDWYDKVEVSAFLCPVDAISAQCASGEASEEQIAAIREYLETDEMQEYVESYAFETKAEAYERFQERMEGTSWAQVLTEEQMQASFRIKLKDPTEYEVVAEALSGRSGVDTVVDQRAQLEPIFNVLNKLTLAAGALAAVMILTALLLMPTTIRLSAMSRRNETEIMRYVGASNFFIELPFILEGVLSALLGAVLAVAGLYVVVEQFIQKWFTNEWLRPVSSADVLRISPALIVGAAVVAALASWVTLRRYARV